MKKIKLRILGLSYSQTQTGAYALVLAEEKGKRRIPIIIGAPEAQSIAIQLEGLKPTRPLTHDLFTNFALAFNIELLEIRIYKLDEGIFYSELICDNGVQRINIDSRTSDAVALALRFRCPIYTTEEIMEKAGIILDFDNDEATAPEPTEVKLEELEIDELKELLNSAIKDENYEEASKIRDEINNRKK
jgi:bifunctional DNase/RNase